MPTLPLAFQNSKILPPHHVPCSGETPLHYAANKGQVKVCKFLLQVKADVNDKRDGVLGGYDAQPSLHELLFFAFEANLLFPIFQTVLLFESFFV